MNNSQESDCRKAGWAYMLFLANLSVLPVIAFIILMILWRSYTANGKFLATHYRETIKASFLAGVLLAIVSVIIVLLGGFQNPWTWVILIIYLTLCHSLFLLLGVLGFSKARNGKSFQFFSITTWKG
jgi:uncharacterized membrane protein